MKTVPFDFDVMKECSCILEFVVPEHINIFEETYIPDGHKVTGYDNCGPQKYGTMQNAYNEKHYLCFRFENGEWKNIGRRSTYDDYAYRHYYHMVFDPNLARANFIKVGDLL